MKGIALVFFLAFSALVKSKPIMVTFGTNQGPIVPPPSPASFQTPSASARALVPRSPAPVSELPEDIPNPSTYRPLVPHQYRTKLYSYTPPPNLILGTPIDQKYTPSIDKYNIFKKQGRSLGVDYTGPHIFEKQDYEIYEAKKLKTTLQPSVRYNNKPNYYQQLDYADRRQDQNQQYVPQIGIIYSAGVRYYVPQIFYNNNNYQNQNQQQYEEDPENSVYDQSDEKHFYRQNLQGQ